MGFWIFMLIMDLLIPFTMIGFGKMFLKKAPDQINWLQNINVNEESGHLGICTSLLRKDLVYLWTYSFGGIFNCVTSGYWKV